MHNTKSMTSHYCKKYKNIPYEIVVDDEDDTLIRIDIFNPLSYKHILDNNLIATINFTLPFFDKPIFFSKHKEEIVNMAEHEINTLIGLKKI